MQRIKRLWSSIPRWLRIAVTGIVAIVTLYWLMLWAFVTMVLGEPAFGHLFEGPQDTSALAAAQADPEHDKIIRLDASTPPDLQPVMNAIGSTPVVGVGEASHGSHEFFTFRQELAKRLIAERGFRLIGIEAGAADGEALNRYINGSNEDLDEVMAQQKFWIYDTTEFREIVTWLRLENAKRPVDQRVHIYGYDVQDFDKEAALLLTFMAENGYSTSGISALRNPRFDDSSYLQALSATQLNAKISAANLALKRVRALILNQPRPTTREYDFALYLLEGMQTRLRLIQETDFDRAFTLRDRSMAENIRTARGLNRGSPIMLWAHTGHIGKSTLSQMPDGAKMMGYALQEIYADEYVAIGMVFNAGGFVAHAPPSESPHYLMRSFAMGMFGDVPFPLMQTSTPQSDRNPVLALFKATEGNVAFLDVRKIAPNSSLYKLLASAQPYPMPGAVYVGPASARWELSMTPMFDALVVFDTVSASQNKRLGAR